MTMTREMLLSIAQASNGLAMAEEFASETIQTLDMSDGNNEHYRVILTAVLEAQQKLMSARTNIAAIVKSGEYGFSMAPISDRERAH